MKDDMIFDLIGIIILVVLQFFQWKIIPSNELADRIIKILYFVKVITFFKASVKIENCLYLKGIRSHYI